MKLVGGISSLFFWSVLFVFGSMTAVFVAWGTSTVTSQKMSIESHIITPNETMEVLAIKDLHSRLDDNNDGQVDYKESTEFVREKFPGQSQNPSANDRSHTLHLQDNMISLDELWNRWKNSNVYNWSNDDVIKWLEAVVDLPELVPQFHSLGITGRQLPLIATNVDQLFSQLGVTRHQRKKLQLRAMDIVLFGPLPSSHSYWKDVVMAFSVILCVLGLSTAWRKHHSANRKIDAFLKEIRVYETELRNIKKTFKGQDSISDTTDSDTRNTQPVGGEEETDRNNSLSDDSSSSSSSVDLTGQSSSSSSDKSKGDMTTIAEETSFPGRPDLQSSQTQQSSSDSKNENLRMRIWNLENQLASLMQNRLALKQLLIETCLQEKYYLDANKRTAENEVMRAQKMCDKIKRKRASVIGAFRLANSSTLEDAGLMITKAVNKMQMVTEHFESFQKRWQSIEQIFGFPILNPAHISTQSLASAVTDSPRSTRGSISHRPKSVSSRTNSFKEEHFEPILHKSSIKMGGGRDREMEIYPRSCSLSEPDEQLRGADRPLPSWFSAPNSLYCSSSPSSTRSSYSEILEIMQQEGSYPGAVSDSNAPASAGLMFEVDDGEKDSVLGIIEEEGSGVFIQEEPRAVPDFIQKKSEPLPVRTESHV
ncbi:PREDICTED: stromal interaction molecule 1-like isoform X2 [Amphimedon queenslandica]|uniref:SAM domain-containing protein n=1 Tax=Amphimedon queenslandica TaxID=400682 RepID=A0A1X7UME7_AMPQE|nr:PREDICTED: stromal interaction molecule 1-like isoform X2 [Amphimedon queenslandica]|eukprot:XP_003387480.1 PREDICTED: stromal interaction molecule 1-like isoform X2 [Amphimedon queenslandica]